MPDCRRSRRVRFRRVSAMRSMNGWYAANTATGHVKTKSFMRGLSKVVPSDPTTNTLAQYRIAATSVECFDGIPLAVCQ